VTSSDAPSPPGGPLRQDQPDGPLQPSGNEHDTVPDDDDGSPTGPVPPVHEEPAQSETDAALQEENAETSLDQPSS
jgi:hypothetical protein